MKWKLTGRYMASVVLIVVIVIFMNVLLLAGLYTYKSMNSHNPLRNKEISAETLTRSFSEEIVISESEVAITGSGKKTLDRNQAWIQILDETGRQVYGYHVPEEARTNYTPMDIVQTYKYMEKELMSTVFIGERTQNGVRYSYLIGFTSPFLERIIFTYDIRSVGKFLQIGILVVICVDGIIALCIAYLFSKRLTRPLHELIDGIKRLAHKNYNVAYETKGIYKDVLYNVNLLSKELRASEAEGKKLDRMKEEWIANITHDIKTPLASIQGYAELMKDRDYDFTVEEMRDYAEIIERKAFYLKDVIEDLNLSTRLRNKQLTLNLKKVNIVSLVRNAVIDTLNDAPYGNRNIDFGCTDEVIKLEVDEILIRRAVSNLIHNAVVHNDDSIAIQVSVETEEDAVRIVVEDQGKGIPDDELDVIFDRYYRGTNTGELHKGSGLGMAITHDIVKAHGGEIHVTSELGRGTRIEIVIIKKTEVM